jgi:hypothetical protein
MFIELSEQLTLHMSLSTQGVQLGLLRAIPHQPPHRILKDGYTLLQSATTIFPVFRIVLAH